MFLFPIKSTVDKVFVAFFMSILMCAISDSMAVKDVHAHEAGIVNIPTIIGGEEVAENIYPWTVALIKEGSGSLETRQFCGGTLIAPEWVLTAAHCTFRGTTPRSVESITVLLGTTSLDEQISPVVTGTTTLIPRGAEQVAISEILRHPEYVRATANADIALLRLSRPVAHPTVAIGNASQLSPEQREDTVVLGWGKTETTSRSTILRQVNVPLVDWETCHNSYSTFSYDVNENMICAGYALGGKDACTGDSGGPLVAPMTYSADGTVQSWSLIGVVSWGRGCAQIDAYGVYANVALLSSWITTVQASANPVGSASTQLPAIYLPFIH